jgi:hypothetical protein
VSQAPASPKAVKREDDDDDVGVTQGRPHLAASLVRRAVGGRRGRVAGPANGLKAGLGQK